MNKSVIWKFFLITSQLKTEGERGLGLPTHFLKLSSFFLFSVSFHSSSFLFLDSRLLFSKQNKQNNFLRCSGTTRTWPSCVWATDTNQHSAKPHLLKITRAPTWSVYEHVCGAASRSCGNLLFWFQHHSHFSHTGFSPWQRGNSIWV